MKSLTQSLNEALKEKEKIKEYDIKKAPDGKGFIISGDGREQYFTYTKGATNKLKASGKRSRNIFAKNSWFGGRMKKNDVTYKIILKGAADKKFILDTSNSDFTQRLGGTLAYRTPDKDFSIVIDEVWSPRDR